ncbi:MAG TPA: hypothetical protein VFE47_09105 [Tepidisphaeraceae bacterium]|nr:hypothetical protein [Tepidisphaeraceae bacterium]
MRLRIFPLVCLLLVSAVAVGWARSYRFAESVEIVTPRGGLLVTSHPARLCACWPSPLAHPAAMHWRFIGASVVRDDRLPAANSYDSNPVTMQTDSAQRVKLATGSAVVAGVRIQFIEVAYWILLAIPALPLMWMLLHGAWRTMKCHQPGKCRNCGYDLRASPVICPECGAPVAGPRIARRWPWRLAGLLTVALLVVGVRQLSIADWHTTYCRPIDFATLGGFKFDGDQGTLLNIPHPLRQLDGQRVETDGFMIPMNQNEKCTEFALFPSFPSERSFPLIQQAIVARTVPGKSLNYVPYRLRIKGTLHVRVQREDGYNVSIYDMTIDSAQIESSGEELLRGNEKGH